MNSMQIVQAAKGVKCTKEMQYVDKTKYFEKMQFVKGMFCMEDQGKIQHMKEKQKRRL